MTENPPPTIARDRQLTAAWGRDVVTYHFARMACVPPLHRHGPVIREPKLQQYEVIEWGKRVETAAAKPSVEPDSVLIDPRLSLAEYDRIQLEEIVALANGNFYVVEGSGTDFSSSIEVSPIGGALPARQGWSPTAGAAHSVNYRIVSPTGSISSTRSLGLSGGDKGWSHSVLDFDSSGLAGVDPGGITLGGWLSLAHESLGTGLLITDDPALLRARYTNPYLRHSGIAQPGEAIALLLLRARRRGSFFRILSDGTRLLLRRSRYYRSVTLSLLHKLHESYGAFLKDSQVDKGLGWVFDAVISRFSQLVAALDSLRFAEEAAAAQATTDDVEDYVSAGEIAVSWFASCLDGLAQLVAAASPQMSGTKQNAISWGRLADRVADEKKPGGNSYYKMRDEFVTAALSENIGLFSFINELRNRAHHRRPLTGALAALHQSDLTTENIEQPFIAYPFIDALSTFRLPGEEKVELPAGAFAIYQVDGVLTLDMTELMTHGLQKLANVLNATASIAVVTQGRWWESEGISGTHMESLDGLHATEVDFSRVARHYEEAP